MCALRVYLAGQWQSGEQVALLPAQFNYLKNVLRLSDGERITVFNGANRVAEGVVTFDKKSGQVTLGEPFEQSVESPLETHLLQAMGKGEKMDWVVQKAVELGVSRITPITTQRSVVELKGERADKRHGRFIDITISACEQSGRNFIPLIDPITPFEQALSLAAGCEMKWILHPKITATNPMPTAPPRSIAVLIGPEGGFTQTEIATACAQGFTPITLGPRVLRTETAPIVALTALQLRFGDFTPR
ncbi:MAG: 16S rRNA (uracil(1498)-N(3))-methyltransferase [Halothiobacillus sp.]